ncbi:hypothetical protein [Chryseobacterium sp. ERMR1:04]|uniref:hypothetical protein n=1 Tax=Chryseobacterium sp. ERMR1:04 TaxID=1705393 RepID=UPI000AA25ED7|nr:hypothetical protein [Chryseobacterium sp. ERMR1:04]
MRNSAFRIFASGSACFFPLDVIGNFGVSALGFGFDGFVSEVLALVFEGGAGGI